MSSHDRTVYEVGTLSHRPGGTLPWAMHGAWVMHAALLHASRRAAAACALAFRARAQEALPGPTHGPQDGPQGLERASTSGSHDSCVVLLHAPERAACQCRRLPGKLHGPSHGSQNGPQRLGRPHAAATPRGAAGHASGPVTRGEEQEAGPRAAPDLQPTLRLPESSMSNAPGAAGRADAERACTSPAEAASSCSCSIAEHCVCVHTEGQT